QILAALGTEEAESRFELLLNRLSHPPAFTCVRVNTGMASPECVREGLSKEIGQQMKSTCDIPILQHPDVPDVLLIPVIGPRASLERLSTEVLVGAQCGNAVLRGAHVFAPGILSTPKYMKAGDVVSVFSDIEGKCTKGAMEFKGNKVFIGNGVAEMSRSDIFCSDKPVKGIGIRMTEPVYFSPSFDRVLSGQVFLQNLPSVVVGHVLGPRTGERVLDMCAAPGGKTTHIATLMMDQGEVIAIDKIASKVELIKANAQTLQLNCIKAYCFNGIKALSSGQAGGSEDGPPFPPRWFDRVLLDAPCSGLGQRPYMACSWSLKELTSYQPLQRKLFHTAVQLLKSGGVLVYSTCTVTLAENEEQVAWALKTFPCLTLQPQAVQLLKSGGVLVYSTCTVTLAENEEQVAWALKTFPCLTLQPQEPHVGGGGMLGAGLSHDQLKLLQRFSPAWVVTEDFDLPPGEHNLPQTTESDLIHRANKDTIGFFFAKFVKM
ncbi:NSUN6 methyltransferase, partial [Amia calva]|nr:NSUN6 methyltransferase [Amia calva]